MKVLFISVLLMLSLTGCEEFAKDAGTTTKRAAEAVGDAGNELAKTVKDTIERNKD